MKFAALWVTACIAVHSFAMDHEDGSIVANDNFYIQGLGIMQAEKVAKEAELLAEEARDAAAAGQNVDVEMVDQDDRDLNLLEGRLRREELKKALLQHINQD